MSWIYPALRNVIVKRGICALTVLLAMSACTESNPEQPCQASAGIKLPVTFVAGTRPTVLVTVNGQVLHMLLDTGEQYSVLTPAVMEGIGATYDTNITSEQSGPNGSMSTGATIVDQVQFGGMTFHSAMFVVTNFERPGTLAASQIEGVIGEDFLQNFNIALDFPHHDIELFARGPCASALPWSGSFTSQTFNSALSGAPVVHFTLNSHDMTGIIDSGAAKSIVKQQALGVFGITPELVGDMQNTVTIGGLHGMLGRERFATLAIGNDIYTHVWLRAGTINLPDADALIGVDYFRAHEVYIDNDNDTIWLSPSTIPVR